tara:strand:- start:10549 stop:10800 length:252 start_codon:yes stop_codon:yes gene_type:complete
MDDIQINLSPLTALKLSEFLKNCADQLSEKIEQNGSINYDQQLFLTSVNNFNFEVGRCLKNHKFEEIFEQYENGEQLHDLLND